MGRFLAGLLLVVGLGGLWLWSAVGRSASSAGRGPTTLAGQATGAEPAATRAAAPAPLEAPSRTDELAHAPPEPGARTEPERAPVEREPSSGDGAPAGDDLVVEVVDPAGQRLAGIPVRLDPGGNSLPEGVSGPRELVTDARGRACFAEVRPLLARAESPWILRHELPFDEPPQLVLAPALLAAPVLVSTLPWGGPLDVVVRELDGASAPRGSTLRLRLLAADDGPEDEPSGPEWKVELADGATRFPWVELGRSFELEAWRPEGTAPARRRSSGPRVGGEGVRVELVLGADQPVVSFRVLTDERRPLASAAIELGRFTLFGGFAAIALQTDARGRFTIDGEALAFRSKGLIVTHRTPTGHTLQGRANLPKAPAVGWNDGGDIVLASEPLLCAGRVVDERGSPVAEASVVAGVDRPWWGSDSATRRAKSATDGRFELRGLWHEDEFELHAEADGRRSDERRVRQGTADVVLVLTRRHALRGQLVLEPGIDPQALRFALQAAGEEAFSVDRRREDPFRVAFERVEPRPPEHFELQPVPAGVYDLLLQYEGHELARLPGLALRADLDVGAIDLRGSLRVCEIELVGAEEPGELSGEFSFKPSGSEQAHGGRIEGERVRILTPTVPIDVELRPRGYRQASLADVSGHRRHALEPALRVRIVLQTGGVLPARPYTFGCELYRSGSSVGERDGPQWFTPENRELAFRVSTPGRLEVRWHLERRIEGASFGGAMGSHVLQPHWREIEVLDVPGEQVFGIALDAEALTELAREPHW